MKRALLAALFAAVLVCGYYFGGGAWQSLFGAKVPEAKGPRPAPAQAVIAKHFYRPVNKDAAAKADLDRLAPVRLVTIDGAFGGWSEAQFVTAMTRGTGADGSHLYPAFPYTSYQRMRVEDVRDLFAFLKTLPPVSGQVRDHGQARAGARYVRTGVRLFPVPAVTRC